MTDVVQPGWYPAPGEPGLERQWDGATWTEERRPVAPRRGSPSGLVIAGFVISIVSLLLSFLGGGLIPGVVALILLAIGGKRGGTSLGMAGSVMSIIAIVLSIVIVAVRVAATGSGTL